MRRIKNSKVVWNLYNLHRSGKKLRLLWIGLYSLSGEAAVVHSRVTDSTLTWNREIHLSSRPLNQSISYQLHGFVARLLQISFHSHSKRKTKVLTEETAEVDEVRVHTTGKRMYSLRDSLRTPYRLNQETLFHFGDFHERIEAKSGCSNRRIDDWMQNASTALSNHPQNLPHIAIHVLTTINESKHQ